MHSLGDHRTSTLGHYIFKDPLDNYWREKLTEERRLQQESEGGAKGGAMITANSEKKN